MVEDNLEYEEFVNLVLDALEEAKVPYLIGGAVAAWAWGEPRATRDLDLVVRIPKDGEEILSRSLRKRGMELPPDIIRAEMENDRADVPLNAIHASSGYKADLYLLRGRDPFRTQTFQRRVLIDLGPALGEVYLHTPEDLIINKLVYFSISQQTKHLRDITAIVKTLGDELDTGHIQRWVDQKGLGRLWDKLLSEIHTA